MKNIKALGYAGIGTLALSILTPAATLAGTDGNVTSSNISSSLVHRVSHSLASTSNYTANSNAGYKWGRSIQHNTESAQWATSTPARSGNKWNSSQEASGPEAQSYAGASAYEWGTMNFAGQAGYRWGLNSFAGQSGYRWGLNSFADQSGYRWGLNSFADQSGYRWGLNSFADQSGYRWGLN